MKLGMKQFAGITRVTLRKRDGYIFVINDPEVLKSADGGNSSDEDAAGEKFPRPPHLRIYAICQ